VAVCVSITLSFVFRKHLVFRVVSFVATRGAIAPARDIPWAPGPDVAAAPASTRPPNVVLIVADDLGLNDVSTFGGGVGGGGVPTPHIDALAAAGATFTQAYAGTATCAPSRAMILTGRYPTRTGFEFTPMPRGMARVINLFAEDVSRDFPVRYDAEADAALPPMERQGLPGSEVTVAEVLRSAGYHTIQIGKWHLGHGPEFGPNAQGFDEALSMAGGLYLPEDDPSVVNAKLDFDLIDKVLWGTQRYAAVWNGGERFAPRGYLTDYYADEAIAAIRANRNRPFFLYLEQWGVHSPLQATRADVEAVGHVQGPPRVRVYAAMVRALDRSVGRIVEALEAAGIAENTLVVFTSDNGGAGYIGIRGLNAPYRGWKATFFEGGIRVPLFLRWPARIPAGTRIETPVAHIDLLPTLAAAARAPLPPGVAIDGVDLLPWATGTAAIGAPPHDELFWQSGHYAAIRRGDWKLQVSERPPKRWLFDLARDPTERHDLAAERPEVVAELAGRLDAHRRAGRAPIYPAALEAPIPIDKTMADVAAGDVSAADEYVYWAN
jgi:uncharacterized sulfatase